jgi:alpha-tubulin suppressor-like RCC1 family protein
MSLNVKNLQFEIAKEIDKISSSTSNEDLLKFSSTLKQLKTGVVLTVSTFGQLPVITPEILGQIYYVESTGIVYYADISGVWKEFFVFTQSIEQTLLLTTLWAWGHNNCNQLGDGSTTTSRLSPVTPAGGGTNWSQVSGGSCHTAAVKQDGTLWTWGFNSGGRLGDGTTTNRNSPVTTAGGGTDWCQVSGGSADTAAVKTDGTLWTWGCNGSGRLGDGSTTNRSSPGTTAGGGTDWCQASSGCSSHQAAVKTNGTLWTWGQNGGGQLGTGNTTDRSSPGTTAGGGTDWCQVSGGGHTAAVKTDGTLWTWGCNTCGQLGAGSTTNRSSPGTTAGGGTNWCQASAGRYNTAAVKQDGTLWTWGFNAGGQLGDGSTTNRISPGTTAGGGTDWCQVSGGDTHTAAVKTDGTLWTWGNNAQGRLGDGSTTLRSSPGLTAGGGTNWCQVSTGCAHTAAVRNQVITITT